MPVYSHSRKNSYGILEGVKLLIDHLRGVKEKACGDFFSGLSFNEADRWQKVLELVCWLHDIGKYTTFFQAYLLNPKEFPKANWHLKGHSAMGAHVAYKIFDEDTEAALIAYFLIKMHHSNLLNFDDILFIDDEEYEKTIFHKQIENLLDINELIQHLPALEKIELHLTDTTVQHKAFKKIMKPFPIIERYFKINYLFSLLIEADKLDASDTSKYHRISLDQDAVDKRKGFGLPLYPDKDLRDLTQNELRNYVRANVVRNIERDDILTIRLFSLAAPTGIGKTLTALDFALKLRKLIEKQEHYRPQIIYALPFINIIEQSLSEYEKTLQAGKIIAHYQLADVFGQEDPVLNGIDDHERSYARKQMEWDTWQSDIVITSFVQFFETLIGNRNRLLKKFHHLAGSIIILDEVQTLSIKKLPVIGAALYYLSKYMNARIIVMTATQPKLFELMSRELQIKIEGIPPPLNLLPQDDDIFECFNRTKIIPKIDTQVNNEDFIKLFLSLWKKGQNCVIVVNKVQRSIDIFNLLSQEFKNEPVELFYLSTNITPSERHQRILALKKKLENKNCILVSTQVVEAGVDLDFDIGFRDMGPIDSIVQVAGRVNRENSFERKGAPLYVIDFGDCRTIYGYGTDSQARKALIDKGKISEPDYKKLVECYFDQVTDKKVSDFTFSREIFEAMKGLQYCHPSQSSKKGKTVSDFQIIENKSQAVCIFIELPTDTEATKARNAFQGLLTKQISKEEFEKEHKRMFNQRIIAVPAFCSKVSELRKQERLTDEILWLKPELSSDYYDVSTGFLRQQEQEAVIVSF